MTIRESGVVVGIAWAMSIWALGFAANTVLAADYLTSPQWRSLMTVPGGKWFWTGIFAAAGVTLIAGLIESRFRIRATGLALIGVGCAGIGVFYIIAPFFDLGPITLGYWPWFIPAGIGLLGAIANWWPLEWF